MNPIAEVFSQLDGRRRRLRMSKADLARRAGVSLPTVQRLLAGRESRPRIDIVTAIAVALGVEVRLGAAPCVHDSTAVSAFRLAQARLKARRLARLVQGTMALEAEAVSESVVDELEEQNVHALLAGPARRLWGE